MRLSGAALQPDCPVNLLSMDALHYKHGELTGNEVKFLHERICMRNGRGIRLPRDAMLRLNFMTIEPEAEFVLRGIRPSVEYFLV